MFNYGTRLGNLLVKTDKDAIEGQLAEGSTDDNALCLKALVSNITSNPEGLHIEIDHDIKAAKMPFLVSKTDNQLYTVSFRYNNGWYANNEQCSLSDYGITFRGLVSNGDIFTAKYSIRNITKVMCVDENKKMHNITKRLVEVGSNEYTVQGPLTCTRGKDFNLYTFNHVPFSIECTVKSTSFGVSGTIMSRVIDNNNFWRLYVVLGMVFFTNCAQGRSTTMFNIFKLLRVNKFSKIRVYTTSTTLGKFKLEVDGVPTLLNTTILSQHASVKDCEIIAGASNMVFTKEIIVSGVNAREITKERKMTVPISNGRTFYSKETWE